MKQIALILIFIAVCGCKKNEAVAFCEGTDKNGKGIKCGTVFTAGDIAIVAETAAPLGTDTLYVKLIDSKDGDALPESIVEIKVDPASTKLRADISIYDESDYRVVIETKDRKQIAEGTVKIVENY